ncbi:MAG: tRNA (adenosine(37)-N6)-threonylcarbamoyltransferase complex dimerization subunit type 1 TsaB, partial [Nitrospirae bacterium]|nr:tRNA (adenosine(37)-N6)-threonylcarbamoyltransferase complex dimerization subunit type 1 TsaB [Nitrospirota bacterium]
MLTLGINTASSVTSIALLSEGKLVGENSWQSHNDEAEKLMPAIAELLGKADAQLPQIERVIVISGPGSFTGLRVGVTVANTIAYLNECDLYAVDTFGYWWTTFSYGKVTDDKWALSIFAGSKG